MVHSSSPWGGGTGWVVRFLTPAAVTAKGHQLIKFFVQDDPGHADWGSSIVESGAGKEVHVPTVDLAEVVRKVLDSRKEQGAVVVKMDIEGAEYEVMPRLDEQGCFCANKIRTIALEWHGSNGMKLYGTDHVEKTSAKYKGIYASAACPQWAGGTQIVMKDDEGHLLDREYPLEQLCKS